MSAGATKRFMADKLGECIFFKRDVKGFFGVKKGLGLKKLNSAE